MNVNLKGVYDDCMKAGFCRLVVISLCSKTIVFSAETQNRKIV